MENTKEKIFIESAKLFSSKGFYAVSVRNIAKNVGITQSSLYNHFKSKEEILSELYVRIESKVFAELGDITDMQNTVLNFEPDEYLLSEFDTYYKFWNENENMWQLLCSEQYSNKVASALMLGILRFYSNRAEKGLYVIQSKGNVGDNPNIKHLARSFSYKINTFFIEYFLRKKLCLDTSKLYQTIRNDVKLLGKTLLLQ